MADLVHISCFCHFYTVHFHYLVMLSTSHASLLVTPLSILLRILRHPNHSRNSNSIQPPESLRNTALRQLPIPLVRHLSNPISLHRNLNLRINLLLLPNPLDHIPRAQTHLDRIPIILHLMTQAFDLRESGLQTVPLRFVLLAALRDGEGVGEEGVVFPERELGERGPAGEEVEDGADDGLLLLGELDTRGGFDVGRLDLELAVVAVGGGHVVVDLRLGVFVGAGGLLAGDRSGSL